MEPDEKRRIANEIKSFMRANDMNREAFGRKTELGKGTVDKLLTGLFSPQTLAKVLDKTTFKLKTAHALKLLGGYARDNWIGYEKKFLMLHPESSGKRAVEAKLVSIDWDEAMPGLMLSNVRELTPIGAVWVHHERFPLICIQPVDRIGVRLILSTMISEPCMRGLFLRMDRVVANAYIPTALPVVLKRLDDGREIAPTELGLIDGSSIHYKSYSKEIQVVIDQQYGRLLGADANPARQKQQLKR